MPPSHRRLLWVNPIPVLPDDDGKRQRLLQLLLAATEDWQVTLISPALPRTDSDAIARVGINLMTVPGGLPARGRPRSLARRLPEGIVPREIGRLGAAARSTGRFELAFGDLAAAPAVFAADARRHGLDDPNHEADKYRLIARCELRPVRRVARTLDWFEVRRYERHWLSVADLLTVCSDPDRAVLAPLAPKAQVTMIPNGVDATAIRMGCPGDRPEARIVFVGGMSYAPNVDAAQILVGQILPLIRKRVPGAEVILVGKDPAPEVQALVAPGVTVTGRVEDPVPYLHNATLTLVPLRSGGGTRLKLLEAMASGTPVVTTPVGAGGLALRNGVDALLADGPEALAADAVKLIQEPATAARLATAARERIERDYDWSPIRAGFSEALLAGEPAAPSS